MRRILCGVLFLTLLACCPAGAATKYVMKEIGTLPGDDQSSAEGINSKGQIVCKSWKVTSKEDAILPKARAFLWENGRVSEIKAPVGKDGVCRMDINDSGTILVSGWQDSFVVENGKATKIDPPPGKTSIRGLEINNRGDVLANGSGGKGMQLVIRRAGVSKAIDTPAGGVRTQSGALNHKGQVAVSFDKADDKSATALWEDGKVRMLDGLPEGFEACALADDGTIAGMYGTDDGVKGCVWRNGAVTNLRPPTALFDSWPARMNKNGEVVGICLSEQGGTYAVVWDRNGAPTDLTPEDFYECEASDINDAGVIVGVMFDDEGRSKAVMWTPVK